ncbi:hypothetical protein C8N35_106104 [Breoghania corrubedonensis]|uniref:Uncharacterized protein n=1 Tax=Breoghania corrubedonensis TaxID=665038 RepID=A0A2T5V7K8_9HYPH|nr:hypothetical protein C8N35_106104 [Breoghania corrubedonensis]
MKRLVLFSSLIMVAGLVAVFSAIIYKVNARSDSASAVSGAQMAATISVGPDARVLSTQVDGARLFMLVEEGTARALLQFDATTGKLLGRTDFVPR